MPALEFALTAHGFGAVVEMLVVNQFPGTSAASPATFITLVLENAPLKVEGRADVQPSLGVPKDVD